MLKSRRKLTVGRGGLLCESRFSSNTVGFCPESTEKDLQEKNGETCVAKMSEILTRYKWVPMEGGAVSV